MRQYSNMNKFHTSHESRVPVARFGSQACCLTELRGNVYMLFTGREVCMGKNCARGLEYGPRLKAEGRVYFFPAVNWFYRLLMGLRISCR